MTDSCSALRTFLAEQLGQTAAERLLAEHQQRMDQHGDSERWQNALRQLPDLAAGWWRLEAGCLCAGDAPVEPAGRDLLVESLRTFVPWRKGPLRLGGVFIDTEWRSDWKWDRLAPHVDWRGRRVLDVGAGNGYFGWRMLAAGAREVLACDPTVLFAFQHRLIRRLAGPNSPHLLALRLEDLPDDLAGFDTLCSMGVLYHRRYPHDHLQDLRRRLLDRGLLVLETLIAPGEGSELLPTPDRYAGMRNVHGLPSLALLTEWLQQAGFEAIDCVDVTPTTVHEQRSTDWMPFHSLAQALDPNDAELTVEGLPAPRRAMVLARAAAETAG